MASVNRETVWRGVVADWRGEEQVDGLSQCPAIREHGTLALVPFRKPVIVLVCAGDDDLFSFYFWSECEIRSLNLYLNCVH